MIRANRNLANFALRGVYCRKRAFTDRIKEQQRKGSETANEMYRWDFGERIQNTQKGAHRSNSGLREEMHPEEMLRLKPDKNEAALSWTFLTAASGQTRTLSASGCFRSSFSSKFVER